VPDSQRAGLAVIEDPDRAILNPHKDRPVNYDFGYVLRAGSHMSAPRWFRVTGRDTPTPPSPPTPPQPPTPPTPPTPPPQPPAPIPTAGFRVLIVYNKQAMENERYAKEQTDFMYSGDSLAYLNRVCTKGPDGKTAEFRIWPDTTPTDRAPAIWQEAMRLPRSGLDTNPWLIISNGTTGYSGPMPRTDITAFVKKFEPR
jgi:hypothetical protein